METWLKCRSPSKDWRSLYLAAMLCMAASSLHAQDHSDFFSYNGSFEIGTSSPPLVFPNSHSTVTTVTGWEVYAGGQYPSWLEGTYAEDGSRYTQLTSNGGAGAGDSGISINGGLIAHTPFTVGQMYELSFWAAGGAAQNNFARADLLVGSDLIRVGFNLPTYTQVEFEALAGLEWSQYVVPFVATDTTLSLIVSSPDSTQGGYRSVVYLDNFSISQVPEPGSALLAAAGGLVLLAGRRRRDAR